MKFKFYTVIASVLISMSSISGQDLHFSYYQFTPLSVNPAFAGAFNGSYRVSGIYSNKQGNVSARPYQTFALTADAPIIRGIRKQDWIGIGVEADVLGSSGLSFDKENPGQIATGSLQNLTFLKVGAAYHLALDKKQTNILTLGAQLSNGSRNYFQLSQGDARVFPQTGTPDLEVIEFNNNLSSGGGGNASPNDRISTSHKDWGVGIMLNSRQKTSDLKVGVAVEGITRPKVGISAFDKKYFGLNIHGSYDVELNKRVNLIPGIYYYQLGPANALNVNTHVAYKVDPEKDLKVSAGLGLRNFRAAIIYLGAEFKDIKVGVAYDIDISTLSQVSNSVGGFEICASYMGKIYKKPKVKPIIFCPRL